MSDSSPLLVVQHLTKVFPGRSVPVLDGVSLTVQPGQLVVLMGRSGSGKSTLLHCIAGLEQFDQGEIIIDGTPIRSMNSEQLAAIRLHKLGIVFQFFNLLGSLTLLQNILLPAQIAGLSRYIATDRARSLACSFGIEHVLHQFPSQVSGGEAQRTAIARSLILQPSIILADEPTGNLDEENSMAVFRLFRQIVSEHQASVLFVTHDQSFQEKGDARYRLNDGRIVS